MKSILKCLAVFWLVIVPAGFLVLVFGPMFAEPGPAYVEGNCDAACMDKILAP